MSRELFSTGSVYEPMIGCSRAVRSGNLLHHPPRERVHPGGRLRFRVEIEADCYRG